MLNVVEQRKDKNPWHLIAIIAILFMISSIEGSMIVKERTAASLKNTTLKQAISARCLNTDDGAFYLVPVPSYDQVQRMRKDNEFYAARKGGKR